MDEIREVDACRCIQARTPAADAAPEHTRPGALTAGLEGLPLFYLVLLHYFHFNIPFD